MSKRWPDKIIIGLTGNITTGKSTVMRLAAENGAFTLDADQIVHEILSSDRPTQVAIAEAFGPGFRRPDGSIDRQKLGALVFSRPDALTRLEQIVHPVVRRELFKRVDASDAGLVFIEAIKILEGDLAAECDQIWVTRCPSSLQIERLVADRGMDRETAILRVEAQSTQEAKVAKADVVIDTGGTLADTMAYFNLAWSRLLRALSGRSDRLQPDRVSDRDRQPARRKPSISRVNPEYLKDTPGIDGITIRRGRPADVPAILLLMKRSTAGTVAMTRGELLLALGERGYLIGQTGTTISAVAGWNSDSQIARIERFFVYPPEAVATTGAAVLLEIVRTAWDLTCRVIFAFPADDAPEGLLRLFAGHGFKPVDPETLPVKWRVAVTESRPVNTLLLMRRLH